MDYSDRFERELAPLRRKLSLEEEIVMVSQAGDDLRTIGKELEDICRQQDTADAMNDVIRVGGRVEQASPMDLFMVETSLRLATAGSSTDAYKITPSLESYVGKRMSLESFGSFISRIWEAIMAGLKKVWEAATSFFHNLFGSIPSMRRAIKTLKEDVQKLSADYRIARTGKVGGEGRSLVVNGRLPKTGRDLLSAVDVLSQHVEFYMGEFIRNAESVYRNVANEMKTFDNNDIKKSLNAMTDEALKIALMQSPKELALKQTNDDEFSGVQYYSLSPLLGNKTFYVHIPDENVMKDHSNPIERAEEVQRCVPVVRDSRDSITSFEGEISEIDPRDMVQMCSLMLRMCDLAEEFYEGKSVKAIALTKNELMSTSGDMVERCKEIGNESPNLPYYKAGIKYNTYLTSSLLTPVTQLASSMMASNRALLIVLQKAIA